MESTATKKPREMSGPAQAAKLLRADLKKAFPGIKFSVTSEIYSMGSSINVKWMNGPTNKAVDTIAHRYQYGTFDSMTDCAGIVPGFEGPGAKHVFAQREVSEDIKATVRARIAKNYDLTEAEAAGDYCSKLRGGMHTMIYRFLVNLDLTNGLESESVAAPAANVAEQAFGPVGKACAPIAFALATVFVLPMKCAPSVFMFRSLAGV